MHMSAPACMRLHECMHAYLQAYHDMHACMHIIPCWLVSGVNGCYKQTNRFVSDAADELIYTDSRNYRCSSQPTS